MKSVRFVVTWTLLAVSVGGALAQPAGPEFPSRPLRYIVPFPPGGSTDIVARIVAAALTEGLGQSVIIDNRAGRAEPSAPRSRPTRHRTATRSSPAISHRSRSARRSTRSSATIP